MPGSERRTEEMNGMSRKLAALLLAVMMTVCAAQALAEGRDAAAAAAAGEEVPAAEPVVLATVNGDEIRSDNSAMKQLTDYYTEYYTAYGMDTTDEVFQANVKAVGLQWAIEDTLYRQKAAELNVAGMTDEQKAALEADAKKIWEDNVTSYMTQQGVGENATDEEKAAARITALADIEANYGYTEESYIAGYVESYAEVQARQNVQDAVLGEITVSDEEILNHFNELVEEDRASYEGNIPMYEYYTQYMGKKSYYVPEGYRGITHILLDVDDELMNNYTTLSAKLEEQQEKATSDEAIEASEGETAAPAEGETAAPAEGETAEAAEAQEEPVTEEMVAAARQAILDSVQGQVDEILAKYQAGTAFGDLIAEYGTDPGMTTEPNKTNGYAVHKDSILFDPAFTEGAMSLAKLGDVSEPVLGSYGVHLLHYTRDIPAGAVEMTDEMKEELRTELLSEKENEAVNAMVAGWMNESDIQYTEAGQALLDAAAAANEEPAESVTATEATEETLADGN